VRAMRSISEPPHEISTAVLLDQIAKELVAAERLRLIESKRVGESGKATGDRSRKDGRLAMG